MTPSTCHPDKEHVAHGLCGSCYSREWHNRNKERGREASRRYYKRHRKEQLVKKRLWYQGNKNYVRQYDRQKHLKRMFGLSPKEYNIMLAAQLGCCAVCGEAETSLDNTGKRVKSLSVDHDHKTGKMRQLLCAKCNTVLGLVLDSCERLQLLTKYLEKHRGNS